MAAIVQRYSAYGSSERALTRAAAATWRSPPWRRMRCRRRPRALVRLRPGASPPQPPRLQQARPEDHRQARVPGERLGVLAGEAAGASGRERGAVARHAGDQRRGLGDAEREPIARSGVVLASAPPPARASAKAIARRPRAAPRRSSAVRRVAARSCAPACSPRAPVAPATTRSRRSPAVESSRGVDQLGAHVECQRNRRAGVQGDLEGLAQLADRTRGRTIPRAMGSGWCAPRRRPAAARSVPAADRPAVAEGVRRGSARPRQRRERRPHPSAGCRPPPARDRRRDARSRRRSRSR